LGLKRSSISTWLSFGAGAYFQLVTAS